MQISNRSLSNDAQARLHRPISLCVAGRLTSAYLSVYDNAILPENGERWLNATGVLQQNATFDPLYTSDSSHQMG